MNDISKEQDDKHREQPSLLKRWLFVVLGISFVALAGLGIVLPILPTTPFLLLASYCFVRSSPRLNQWLLDSKWFGPVLYDWQVRGGIKKHLKIKAVIVVSIAVALTIYFSGYTLLPMIAVIVLASIGLFVIYRVKTIN